MFLSSQQLEPVLLKRLEHLRSLKDSPTVGWAHCAISVLQAQSSAAGLEWSSTDGHDEGHQEQIKVDVSDGVVVEQLDAWRAWVSPTDEPISRAQYYATAHAVVQDTLSTILAGSEPTLHKGSLDAAWQEDAAGDSGTIPRERFRSALATFATACSSDGTPQAAAACLAALLSKAQGRPERWKSLVEQYGSAGNQEAGRGHPSGEGSPPAAAAGAAAAAPGGGADDGDDDLDALLGEEEGDIPDTAPPSDKLSEAAKAPAADAAGDDDAAAAAASANDDDDGASSLGLSRVASRASLATTRGNAEEDGDEDEDGDAEGGPPVQRYVSSKSVMDPELRKQIDRSLSGASSVGLGDLPDNLEALEQRQASNGKASTRPPKQSLLVGLMSTEEGKGHLADMPMDLRSWANFKDKQQQTAAVAGPGAVGGGTARLGAGRSDVAVAAVRGSKASLDQHLKGARGGEGPQPGGGNPLHSAIIRGGSAARQPAAGRDMQGGGAGVGGPGAMSRHGSNGCNESPARQRSITASRAANLSRKLSVSEPGPLGPQAEWKHLPALGQASRLHPHCELRQPSQGQLRAAVSRGSPSVSAAALIDDKLPMLPSLAGARGQPPKAMELLRRPSQVQRSDGHHAESRQPPPKGHLPGLGAVKGPQGPRTLVVPGKKSFRGDGNF